MKKFEIARMFAVLFVLAIAVPTSLAYAAEPSEPHAANAIWVEPSLVELSMATISAGYRFNVTVWANCSVDCGGWQIWLTYDKAYLNAVAAGYTGEAKSEFMQNITTISVAPSFKSHNATHNRVEYGETWAGSGPYRNPGYGSLCWIEFNVTSVPEEAEVLLEFNAYVGAVRRTYLIEGPTGNKVDLDVDTGLVRFVPPPPDETPPTIVVLAPINKTYTSNMTDLLFTVNEPVSWIGYSLNDAENVTIGGNTTLTIVVEDSYKLVVYANDTSGNMGVSNAVYFTVILSRVPGDMDGDKDVDIEDLYIAALAFGTTSEHPRWNELADVDGDGYVGIVDLYLIARSFGTGM